MSYLNAMAKFIVTRARSFWAESTTAELDAEPLAHIIDLDADPFVPEGWEVVDHQKGGSFEWDPSKVVLYLSEEQQGGYIIDGSKLREELRGKHVFNANLLDYLLANPDLIPLEWKEAKWIYFWGTVYRRSGNRSLIVRCLYCDPYDRWVGFDRPLAFEWFCRTPAAILAS